jgi:hypothetical protein
MTGARPYYSKKKSFGIERISLEESTDFGGI